MLKKLTDNVFVVWENGSSTSTVIVGKGCSVVVDTSLFPKKARKIKEFAEEIGGSVRYVLNTHYHPDHTFGNSAFEGADFIASRLTREAMENMDSDYVMKVWDEDVLESEHLVIPNLTFEDQKRFTLCSVKIFVKRLGGHTPDSSAIFLEREGVLIAGDLVMNGYHAEITPDSDLTNWLDALRWIRDLAPVHVVPGHGEPGGLDLVSDMRSYIHRMKDFCEGLMDKSDLLMDKNFTSRGFPELFSHALESLLKITSRD